MSSSLSKINLIQSGAIWSFSNEFELEKFIWENIHSLNLTPLKKQHFINGQYCDILAVDSHNRLTIIELKNTEDRYVIQQLTRYYDALIQLKPFSDIIDYSKEPRLIAICPHFHRDNLIDIRYHKLDIELIEFGVIQQNLNFFCILNALSGNSRCNLEIPSQISNPERHLPSPPRKLTNHLLNLDEDKRQSILNIREQILGFDPRINEIVSGSHIFYGKTEKSPCAELFLSQTFKGVKLFLWLPHPDRKKFVEWRWALKILA